MSDRELLPCQGCGGLPVIKQHSVFRDFTPSHRCSAYGRTKCAGCQTPDGAIEFWNNLQRRRAAALSESKDNG